jgi:hypothetical protein
VQNIVGSIKTEDSRAIESVHKTVLVLAVGLQEGKFQFLDRRNQMLAGGRNNARRFACSRGKNLEKLSRDIGEMV